MKHSILIIDDESMGANNLKRALNSDLKEYEIFAEFEEDKITDAIKHRFYDIAIVDLRMDKFSKNGIDFIKEIINRNEFAFIIIMSAYTKQFSSEINEVLGSGKIIGVVEKGEFKEFANEISSLIIGKYNELEKDYSFYNKILRSKYVNLKNEKDLLKKGKLFEEFVSDLFISFGFRHIEKNIKDKSLNEIDLIIRNDIDDVFFRKFSPYFYIECKNITSDIDKNIFIVFRDKLSNSNGMSKLGFIVSVTGFKKTSYLQALRSSQSEHKIVFLSNNEINDLLDSDESLSTLKKIIDKQSRDN